MTQPGIVIQPIKTEQDHSAAIARIEDLMDSPKTAEQRDELEILVTLVDAYESQHHPIGPSDPLAAIEFLLDQKGLTRKDLEPMIGSRARVSEILSGKRPLTLPMIRRLHQQLGVSADVLISLPTGRRLAPRRAASRERPRSATQAR